MLLKLIHNLLFALDKKKNKNNKLAPINPEKTPSRMKNKRMSIREVNFSIAVLCNAFLKRVLGKYLF